jgi:hypothetical protein
MHSDCPHSGAPPPLARAVVAGAVVAGVLALALWPRAATAAEPVVPHRVFLPWVAQPPPVEPCGPPVTDPCADDNGQHWVVVCGGFGRLRDMVIPNLTPADGPFELLAVGDGAAWLTVWPAATPGAPSMVRWQPRLGTDLTGLNALGFDLEAAPGSIQGWAVGERDRILTLRGSCLRREDDYESAAVELTAVNGDAPHGGWIVGRAVKANNGATPREVGVWRIMADPNDPSSAAWRDFQAAVTPPPLSDVAFQYNRQYHTTEAWSVGAAGGTGTFLHGAPGPDGAWRWTEGVRRPGSPREMALRSEGAEGWAFGPGTRHGQAGLAAWYYSRNNINWEQVADLFWPGRELVDVYSESRLTAERMSVGISPAGAAPVIARLDFTTRQWQELAVPPPGLPATAGDGSQAIAPDGAGHTVYAWADDVWLYHEPPATVATEEPPATGTPDSRSVPGAQASWSLLRRARPLLGFVPTDDGGWAIADAGAGSDVLRQHDQAFQAVAHTAQRLRAMDAAGTVIWAVGDAGLTLRADGGHWRTLASQPPVDGDLLDVAVVADGSAWAAGVGPDGAGRAWRWAPGALGWTEVGRTTGATPLRAIAARAEGLAWAAGDGCTVLALPAGAPPQQANPCAGATVPTDLVTVAAPGPRSVWAAGGYYVYHWNGSRWSHQSLGLGTGEHIAALAAAPPEDIWAAAWTARPAGRAATMVFHFDGRQWRPDTVLSVPIAELRLRDEPAGRRSLWASGVGSTVARREYAPH